MLAGMTEPLRRKRGAAELLTEVVIWSRMKSVDKGTDSPVFEIRAGGGSPEREGTERGTVAEITTEGFASNSWGIRGWSSDAFKVYARANIKEPRGVVPSCLEPRE